MCGALNEDEANMTYRNVWSYEYVRKQGNIPERQVWQLEIKFVARLEFGRR